jgi:hypothetical protein
MHWDVSSHLRCWKLHNRLPLPPSQASVLRNGGPSFTGFSSISQLPGYAFAHKAWLWDIFGKGLNSFHKLKENDFHHISTSINQRISPKQLEHAFHSETYFSQSIFPIWFQGRVYCLPTPKYWEVFYCWNQS